MKSIIPRTFELSRVAPAPFPEEPVQAIMGMDYADIGGYGQNAGHHCAQKGMTGIGKEGLATRHPGVSAAPFTNASDEKIVTSFVPK
jgi:hypothetical protein